MTILINGQPFVFPVFQQVGFVIQSKPFPAFYQWTDFLDFTEFDARITAIEAGLPADLAATLAGIIGDVSTAQSTADNAITNAAAAQSAADAAQGDATAALAGNSGNSALLPRYGHFHSDDGTYINGTPAYNTDGTYPYAGGWFTTTQNAHVEFYITCREGTSITVNLLTQRLSSGAIFTFYLDGVLFGTQDTYNATTQKAVVIGSSTGSVGSGDHTIAIKALTKNASSSGYNMFLNRLRWNVN